jgi:hypothetical protein
VGLIPGSFTAASATTPGGGGVLGKSSLPLYFPSAALGQGNYIFVYSNGGNNYYAVEAVTYVSSYRVYTGTYAGVRTPYGVTAAQAYGIDAKIDDGLPMSGRVQDQFPLTSGNYWSLSDIYGSVQPSGTCCYPYGAAPAAVGACMDNGDVNNAKLQYTLSQDKGGNCGISIQFQ